jgi:hypothetical protein
VNVSVRILGRVRMSACLLGAEFRFLGDTLLYWENRSRPMGNGLGCMLRDILRLTIPPSSVTPGEDSSDAGEMRDGNTHGLHISPTHSSAMTGPSISTS